MYQTFNTLKLKNKSKKKCQNSGIQQLLKIHSKHFYKYIFFFFGLDLNFKSQNFLNT